MCVSTTKKCPDASARLLKGNTVVSGWLQVAQEALKVPGLLVDIYGDLAKPGVHQVGKALGIVFGLGNTVLWPIHWANEHSRLYLEKNLQDYRARLEHIPLEKIVPVAPEIGVPIAEKLTYVRDVKLADMYVTLLAKASSVDTISEVHPSFVNVINNLSPDEAQLLEIFVNKTDLEFVTAKWSSPAFYQIAGDLLITQEHINGLIFPQNVSAYFSNLSGLGLVSIHHDRILHVSTVYPELEAYWTKQFPTPPAPLAPEPNLTLKFERGAISTTEYGLQFIRACHAK
jgi:hypothetical protein